MATDFIAPARLADRLKSGGLAVVDVRTTTEFRSGHIPGAINVPMDEIESRLPDLPMDRPIVVVCHSGRRAEIVHGQVQDRLEGLQCLEGGVEAWESAGLPVVRSVRTRLALDRQAMIGASLIVLASLLLGAFVAPGWHWLGLLPGAGLMVAGTTGFCLMGSILSIMPWNKPTG